MPAADFSSVVGSAVTTHKKLLKLVTIELFENLGILRIPVRYQYVFYATEPATGQFNGRNFKTNVGIKFTTK